MDFLEVLDQVVDLRKATSMRMMRHHPTRLEPLRLLLIMLSTLVCLVTGTIEPRQAAAATLGPCEPGYVQHWQHYRPVILVAMSRPVDVVTSPVRLGWLGHSSFLLSSPMGLRLMMDPSGLHPTSVAPDVITVSNLHTTHTAVELISGTPQVLWGIGPNWQWNRHALVIRDVALFNLPSYASRDALEDSAIQNSIFVFRTGGLCLVHLGNLRHPLSRKQLAQIGTPDVLMIPADGQWTLAYSDMMTVIRQLQPRLVIPMHIDVPESAEVFVQYAAGRYPARRIPGRTLTLSRASLPTATEIVVFSNR